MRRRWIPKFVDATCVGRGGAASPCRATHFLSCRRVPASLFVDRVRTNLLTASDVNVAGHRFAALKLADQLELLNNQLRGYNKQIDTLLVQHPDHEIFTSFPASGRIVVAELLAEIGEGGDWWRVSLTVQVQRESVDARDTSGGDGDSRGTRGDRSFESWQGSSAILNARCTLLVVS